MADEAPRRLGLGGWALEAPGLGNPGRLNFGLQLQLELELNLFKFETSTLIRLSVLSEF